MAICISLIPSFHIVFIHHTITSHATIIIYPKNFKNMLDLLFASTSRQKTGEQWTQSFQGWRHVPHPTPGGLAGLKAGREEFQ